MLNPGFQRLVVLDGAGYIRAELPLDESVSLIGDNNKGKTSLINALQFLLIIDKRRMNFGAYKLDKSQKFYFPRNCSYILLEVYLPQTGIVVLGAVGKGVSHDYQYFAYKGELNIDHFRMDDGHLVPQPKLMNQLARYGHVAYGYDDKEFKERIYGGASKKYRDEPDFTVFKLGNSNDAKAYQQVLTNTLKLDKLTSGIVKTHLLNIFNRDLANSRIDFKSEWETAFSEVNRERAQYEAVLRNKDVIEQIQSDYHDVLSLRGKVIASHPLVDEQLKQWGEHYFETAERYKADLEHIEAQEKRLTDEIKGLSEQNVIHEQELNKLNVRANRQAALENQFALVPDRNFLESQVETAQTAFEKQLLICSQLESRPLEVIKSDIKSKSRDLTQLENKLKTIENNLYLELAKYLSKDELENLSKALSAQVLQLSPEQYNISIDDVLAAVRQNKDNEVVLSGVTLSLEHLLPQYEQLSQQQIVDQISQLKVDLEKLKELQEASRSAAQAKLNLQHLRTELDKQKLSIKEFDEWTELVKGIAGRESRQRELQTEIDNTKSKIESFPCRTNSLLEQKEALRTSMLDLEEGNNTIADLVKNRVDGRELFQYLEEQPHHPWSHTTDWNLDKLPQNIRAYHVDCLDLETRTRQLKDGLKALHYDGLTKFQTSQTRDDEITSIVNFYNCLDDENRTLERMARGAVVNVTLSLKELRHGLDGLQSKMQEFNRLISRKQLSDLDVFKVRVVEEKSLVDAIDVLISQAEQSSNEQSFDLFNQSSLLDDVDIDSAKQTLIDEGNARQGLKVEDLFRLEFVVGKYGQDEESFEDIDSAASHGTVLMAKLVTGLAMLHLMQDQRHQVKAVCYLDEALALDGKNQANLIEIARQFGFSLIFASPSPLTTVRYCVPISHKAGKNYITSQAWQIFEPLDEASLELVS